MSDIQVPDEVIEEAASALVEYDYPGIYEDGTEVENFDEYLSAMKTAAPIIADWARAQVLSEIREARFRVRDEFEYRMRTAISKIRIAERHGEPYPKKFVDEQIEAGKARIYALLTDPKEGAR